MMYTEDTSPENELTMADGCAAGTGVDLNTVRKKMTSAAMAVAGITIHFRSHRFRLFNDLSGLPDINLFSVFSFRSFISKTENSLLIIS